MGMKRGTRLLVAALGGVAGLLALLNFHLLQSLIDISPVASPTDKADTPRQGKAAPATALDNKTAEEFQEIVRRPLFNPTRRPVQHETRATAPTVASGNLRLIGVMKLGKQPPRALIRFGDEPTGKWITEGAEVNGWKLRKVNERSVIVQAGERSQELKLATPRRLPEEPSRPKP